MHNLIRRQKYGILYFFLFAVLLMGIAVPVVSAESTEEPQDAVIFFDTQNQEELDYMADRVTALGGMVLATFPTRAMFASLTLAQSNSLQELPEVELLSFELVDGNDVPADIGAQAAAAAWNARFEKSPIEQSQYLQLPDIDDQRYPPDLVANQAFTTEGDAAEAVYQTSEFMIGSLQVDVFLPESNGTVDPNLEHWDAYRIEKVMAEVVNGITWWINSATEGDRPSANLSANIVFHTPLNEPLIVSTGYEPISRTYANEGLWMGEILSKMGYTGNYFSALRQYAHNRRVEMKKDWGFSVWIVDSYNDADGRFEDKSYFAYSYVNGPMFVMTYDNDGWGINRMDIVSAHEMGHTFGALDEYAASGCKDSAISGYLGVANTNCENGDPAVEASIMRSSSSQLAAFPYHLVSTPVRGMVGWRDKDGDGIYDPVDTTPKIDQMTAPTDMSIASISSILGDTSDVPHFSSTRPDVTINTIKLVEARIDGEAWSPCLPSDGSFNEIAESFSCSIPLLSANKYTIEVRSRNSYGNYSFLNLITEDGVSLGPQFFTYLPLIEN
ncbi:MAG: hypothetical protein EHM41_21450 [Chloroflexi bacterium]|nr:MAG: hypothetical protein EHM41_21450 [Chloroflexota bacterium]